MSSLWTGEQTVIKAQVVDLEAQAAAVSDQQLACDHRPLRWECCELCGEHGYAEECSVCGVLLGNAGRKIRRRAREIRGLEKVGPNE